MKIRHGFVSNSSSSSFTCDVCGHSEAGYDLSHYDACMHECENGHTICQDDLLVEVSVLEEEVKKLVEENPDEYDEQETIWYEMPEKYCPICAMVQFSNYDLKRYLKKKTNITEAEAFESVKAANRRRKKLYDGEYVMYAIIKTGTSMVSLIKEIKELFSTYKEFKTYLNEN